MPLGKSSNICTRIHAGIANGIQNPPRQATRRISCGGGETRSTTKPIKPMQSAKKASRKPAANSCKSHAPHTRHAKHSCRNASGPTRPKMKAEKGPRKNSMYIYIYTLYMYSIKNIFNSSILQAIHRGIMFYFNCIGVNRLCYLHGPSHACQSPCATPLGLSSLWGACDHWRRNE